MYAFLHKYIYIYKDSKRFFYTIYMIHSDNNQNKKSIIDSSIEEIIIVEKKKRGRKKKYEIENFDKIPINGLVNISL